MLLCSGGPRRHSTAALGSYGAGVRHRTCRTSMLRCTLVSGPAIQRLAAMSVAAARGVGALLRFVAGRGLTPLRCFFAGWVAAVFLCSLRCSCVRLGVPVRAAVFWCSGVHCSILVFTENLLPTLRTGDRRCMDEPMPASGADARCTTVRRTCMWNNNVWLVLTGETEA